MEGQDNLNKEEGSKGSNAQKKRKFGEASTPNDPNAGNPAATEEHVPLRILVDEVKNIVVSVQAGKDFVDVLLSFLTLPLGTIASLVANESNMKKVSIGSLSSLYECVANMEVNHFLTEACKEMLLHPRNSMESYCRNLKLKIDNTENIKFFICENWNCSRQQSGGLLTTFKNQRCKCGKLMNREISPQNASKINNEGFTEMGTFIISDNLKVMPGNFQASLLDIGDFNAIKEVTASVTQKEMVDLLKCCLLSETPLTDFFLRNKKFSQSAKPSALFFNIGKPGANVGGDQMIKLKVIIRKSKRKILFALAEEDFVDLLFSFLTFPLGGVEQMLKGNSCFGSIDNLYKSVVYFDDFRYLRSDLKGKLVNCGVAPHFRLRKQLLPIGAESINSYYCYSKFDSKGILSGCLTVTQAYKIKTDCDVSKDTYARLSYLEPQSLTGEVYNYHGGRGFVKKLSLYMVTDDLVVTSSSSFSAFSFLSKLRIPPEDLEEKVISIGKEEGLSILKASLISSSALTNGLSQIINPMKEENTRN